MDDKVHEAGVEPIIDDESPEANVRKNVVEHARAAAEREQNMTLLEGIRTYPKAIFFSIVISTCIVMEGYDISLVNNFCMCGHAPRRSPCLSASNDPTNAPITTTGLCFFKNQATDRESGNVMLVSLSLTLSLFSQTHFLSSTANTVCS